MSDSPSERNNRKLCEIRNDKRTDEERAKVWGREQSSEAKLGLAIALAEHKLWIDSNGEKGAPINLEHQDLRGAKISHAKLDGAFLAFTSFKNADMDLTVLDGALLDGASIKNADMRGATLAGTDLRLTKGGRSR